MKNKQPDLDDFASAWDFLCNHPCFFYAGEAYAPMPEGFKEALDIEIVRINPAIGGIDDDDSKNTQIEIWLECGPWHVPDEVEQRFGADAHKGMASHDPDLDCGAGTFEEAICLLAHKVLKKYGDYPEYRNCSHCGKHLPAGPTDHNEHWFCSESCTKCGAPKWEDHFGEPDERGLIPYIGTDELFDCEHFPKEVKKDQ